MLYYVFVPGTRYLLQRCRRELPADHRGVFVYMQRQVSLLLDSSLVFCLAWSILSVLEIILKLWKLVYGHFATHHISVEVGSWIDFLIVLLLSIYMMCKTSRAKRKNSICNFPVYKSLISSASKEIACVLVGVTFEEALICTFLDESLHSNDDNLWLRQFLFLFAFVIFSIAAKCLGSFIANEMELEIDEMWSIAKRSGTTRL